MLAMARHCLRTCPWQKSTRLEHEYETRTCQPDTILLLRTPRVCRHQAPEHMCTSYVHGIALQRQWLRANRPKRASLHNAVKQTPRERSVRSTLAGIRSTVFSNLSSAKRRQDSTSIEIIVKPAAASTKDCQISYFIIRRNSAHKPRTVITSYSG